jgi:hypothetical protein
MSYSEFSLEQVVMEFNLHYQEDEQIFTEIEVVEPSDWLRETLDFNLPLAIAIGSEKARSEMLIAPIIWEMKRRHRGTISIFSGREFNVDASRGLTGFVDFLIAKSRQQAFIGLPVVVLVEAKKSDLVSGYGQCAAEMVAAQIKNSQPGAFQVPDCLEKGILGIITSGTVWQFLHLKGQELVLDLAEYSIDDLRLLLGALEEFAKV